MSGMLPPVVMTIIADAKKFIDEQAKVVTAADGASKAVIEAAEKEAAAAEKAAKSATDSAAKRTEAADKAAAAAEVAAQKTEAAYARLAAATEEDQAKCAEAVEVAAKKQQEALAKLDAALAAQSDAEQAATAKTEEAAAKRAAADEAGASKSSSSMSSAAKVAGGTAMVMAGASIAVGIGAVDMATKFQTSTTKLVTSGGESENAIAGVRDGILKMSGEVGVSAQDLSDAMYKVESAGYHAQAGLGLLQAAEQGAKAEGADGTKVADALSSALRDYYPHATSAADVTKASTDTMSKFIAATSAGKMTFDDLAGSLNSILPVSSAAGISLSDTMGVLASMTVHGISAEQATQNMADAIRHLQAPSQTMSKAMAEMGISSTEVSQKLGERGLSGTMQFLSEKVKAAMPPGTNEVILQLGNALSKSSPAVQELGQKLMDGTITMGDFRKAMKDLDPVSAGQAQQFMTLANSQHQLGNTIMTGGDVLASYGGTMAKLMGDATGLKVALMTTGENAQYTNDAIKQVSGATADAAGNVKGWSEVQKNSGQSMAELKATIESVAISLGTALLPMVKIAADALKQFLDWATKNPQAFNAMVIGIMAVSVAFGILAVAMMASGITEVGLVIAGVVVAIVALGAGIAWLVTHWSDVTKFITDVWNGFLNWMKGVIDGFVGWFRDTFGPLGAFLKGIWDGIVSVVKVYIDIFVGVWSGVIGVLKGIWDGIVNVVKFAVAILYTAVVAPIVIYVNLLATVWRWLYEHAIKPAWDGIVNAIGTAWNWIYSNVIKPVMDYVDLVGKGFSILWQTYVVPAWQGIQRAIGDAWNWVAQNVVKPMNDALNAIGQWFNWLWNSIITPVWNGIQKAIGDAWNWIVTNVMNYIHDEVTGLGIIFNWLHDNVIKPVWDNIQNAIHSVWQWLSDNVFDPINRVVDGVGRGFDLMGQGIKKVWDGIVDAAKQPVKFIVDQVYNQGIMPVWNDVAGMVGLGKLDPVSMNFAAGGTVPGFLPGQDTVHAMLSPGEGILVPRAVQALGGASGIDSINSMFGGGSGSTGNRFADGGVVGDVLGAIGGAINGVKDAVLGGLRAAASPVVTGLESLADSSLGTTGFGGLIDHGVHTLGDGLLNFLGGKDSSKPKGGASIPGTAASGDVASWVAAAMSAANVAGANWTNGLETIIQNESGGNPRAENDWDVNAQNGDPSRGLMQTIMSTFESYRMASLPDDIFDPVANIVAGIGYIKSRYGDIGNVPGLVSLAAGGGYQGYSAGGVVPTLYDSGGWLPPGRTLVQNNTGVPERVLGPGQTGGGHTITINAVTNASPYQMAGDLGYILRQQATS